MAVLSDFTGLQPQKYDAIRAQIQTGDILFCKGNYAFSKFMRCVSGSMFSHVGLIFTWEHRVLVLESEAKKGVAIRAVPLSWYVRNYNNTGRPYNGDLYIGRFNTNYVNHDSLLSNGMDLLGRMYDFLELIRIGFRVIFKIKNKHLPNSKYTCSEFVDECFIRTKVDPPLHRSGGGFIHPDHIAEDQRVSALFRIKNEV